MTTSAAALARAHTPDAVLLAGAVACSAALGVLAVENRKIAVIAALFGLLLAVAAGDLARLGVVAVVGVWITRRAPDINVSFTDILVAAAGLAALLAGVSRDLQRSGRLVLRCFAFYLGTLSVTLLYNHSLRSDFEFFHRIALVAGGILVGVWLVQAGLHHRALQGLLAVTSVVSIFAVVDAVASGFAPAYPLGYHKNFVGSICATVLLVLLAAHAEFRLRALWLRVGAVLAAAGLLAAQSRGAMLAVAAGALVWYFRSDPDRRRRRRALAAVMVVGFAASAGILLHRELQPNRIHNSFTQRLEVERQTRQLWIDHPLTGVGLRFFATPAYAGYQAPNNFVNEALAEAGVAGLLGFLVFIIGSLVAMARSRGDLALAGLCVISARFVHGLLDIHWVGGTTTLAWMIAGMGLAATGDAARTVRSRRSSSQVPSSERR